LAASKIKYNFMLICGTGDNTYCMIIMCLTLIRHYREFSA